MNIKKIALSTVAIAAVAAPMVASNTADAAVPTSSRTHHVVMRVWGTPAYARVETWGKYDITMRRHLPYTHSEYNSEWSQYVSVKVPGYRTVGCSITVDGRLVARDVSSVGIASCLS